jgi:bifunctional UDP-N-acetylglucosamine pyrophosphorylase/glucosamine-1-phosphate N-acetyltransferase/UDP-N-acetylglucosamine pyrophosphorylase
MDQTTAIVLAAGKGTRMKSDLPKVLIPVCGRPMIDYVLDALANGGVDRVIAVIGHQASLVRKAIDGRPEVEFVLQTEQLGTGHAVMMCRDLLAKSPGPVMVVAGDSPLMQAESIAALLEDVRKSPAACVLGTARKDDPGGLGRILRDAEGNFIGIVEHRDATPEQRRITEVNMSYYVFDSRDLLGVLDQLRPTNQQGEYYITDVPGLLIAQGKKVRALPVLKPCESLGINNLDELAAVEVELRNLECNVKSVNATCKSEI